MSPSADSEERVPPPCEPNGDYIFFSYAHADRVDAYELINEFLSFGVRVWYDAGIALSSDWTDSIAEALDNCSALVVLISPRSVQSNNVKNELRFAVQRNKPI